MVIDMEKENGNHRLLKEIFTKAIISKIKSKVKENIFGAMVQYFKAILIKIKSIFYFILGMDKEK
jgi:hypothetical protein